VADPNGLYESILNGDAMTAAAACGAQTTGGYSENANAGATLAGSAFRKLAVSGPAELVFGCAPKPVRCGFALAIGEGIVFPEVNFTLPAIAIEPGTWGEVCAHYEGIAANIIKRALALRVPGIVLEFELLPAMTETPEWGAEIVALLHRHLVRRVWDDVDGLACIYIWHLVLSF
jgi:hypothetical protein